MKNVIHNIFSRETAKSVEKAIRAVVGIVIAGCGTAVCEIIRILRKEKTK